MKLVSIHFGRIGCFLLVLTGCPVNLIYIYISRFNLQCCKRSWHLKKNVSISSDLKKYVVHMKAIIPKHYAPYPRHCCIVVKILWPRQNTRKAGTVILILLKCIHVITLLTKTIQSSWQYKLFLKVSVFSFYIIFLI